MRGGSRSWKTLPSSPGLTRKSSSEFTGRHRELPLVSHREYYRLCVLSYSSSGDDPCAKSRRIGFLFLSIKCRKDNLLKGSAKIFLVDICTKLNKTLDHQVGSSRGFLGFEREVEHVFFSADAKLSVVLTSTHITKMPYRVLCCDVMCH